MAKWVGWEHVLLSVQKAERGSETQLMTQWRRTAKGKVKALAHNESRGALGEPWRSGSLSIQGAPAALNSRTWPAHGQSKTPLGTDKVVICIKVFTL